MLTPLQQRLTTMAACAVLAFALLPFLVTFLPRIHFDTDPTSPVGMAPITQLGPAALVWLSVASAALSAAVLALCAWMKRPIAWWAVALVAAGVVVQLVHLRPARPDDLWYGPAWIGGALLALAAYHLAQLPQARRWMIAGLIAVIMPVAADSVYFVFVEHPLTVASYQRQQQSLLGERGGVPLDASEVLYERRLQARDAVGALSLSNVLGSLTMTLTLIAGALAAGVRHHWARIAATISAAAGLLTVYLTNSKGAAAALIGGAVLLLLARALGHRRRIITAMCVGMVVAAVGAILVIASLGPPQHGQGGPRVSLLYRFHYWQGAAGLIAELPFLGTGQEAFRENYLRTKNPLSPEDVRSSHNVFVDWIVMLGAGGWAWSALAMTWLVLLARRSSPGGDAWDEPQLPSDPRMLWAPCTVTGGAVFLLQYAVEFELLTIETALLWLVSLAAFVGVMAAIVRARWSERWIAVGLVAAATALLAHNQIEMTFHHAPSALSAWIILGIATAPGATESRPRRWDALAAMLPAATAVALFVLAAYPVARQQAHLARAAAALRSGWGEAALHELDASTQWIAADHVTLRWRIALRLQYAEAFEIAGRSAQAAQRRREALALCDPENFGGVHSYRLDRWRSRIHEAVGDFDAAIADQRAVVARLPYSIPDRHRLGQLLERAGRHAEAAEVYRALLDLSDRRWLDPAVQIDADLRRQIEAYLVRHGG